METTVKIVSGIFGTITTFLLFIFRGQNNKIDAAKVERDKQIAEINGKLKTKVERDNYIKDFDLIVVSPGVPTSLSFLEVAKELGVKVIGEMELGYLFTKCKITAITGTNGKTTTTALVGAIYKKAEYNTYIAGNIGESIAGDRKSVV